MVSIKDIINRYKWDPDKELAELTICYVHRGAENDLKWTRGSSVVRASGGFLEIRNEDGSMSHIPFHRVTLIREGGRTIFDRSQLAGNC